jgi:hypothetical protein
MVLERYEYKKSRTFGQFYFHSDGPKGRVRKVVMYRLMVKIGGFYYYNISEIFDIEGKSKKGWEKFERGRNYLAFRFKRIKFGV